MGISFVIAFILMFFQGITFTWHIILIFPIILILYILTFGIGLLLMHFGVTLNDLSNITNIGLRMVFYLSGVFYNIRTRLSGTLSYILLRGNPIAFCMNELRKVTIYGTIPSLEGLIIWFALGIILCLIGIHVIHKNENSYAKVI